MLKKTQMFLKSVFWENSFKKGTLIYYISRREKKEVDNVYASLLE